MNSSNKISKSQLTNLIKEIVRGIMKEAITPLSGMEQEQSTSAGAGPVTGPGAFKKKGSMEETDEQTIDETSTSGAAGPYNIPGAFSKKGGSARGVAGSAALGYTLTSTGKKEMNRHADKLIEEKFKK